MGDAVRHSPSLAARLLLGANAAKNRLHIRSTDGCVGHECLLPLILTTPVAYTKGDALNISLHSSCTAD